MRCSSKMVGRGRREPVGGEDGVNICCSLQEGAGGSRQGGRRCYESSLCLSLQEGAGGSRQEGEDGEMFMYSFKCCGNEMLLVNVMFIKDVCVIITQKLLWFELCRVIKRDKRKAITTSCTIMSVYKVDQRMLVYVSKKVSLNSTRYVVVEYS